MTRSPKGRRKRSLAVPATLLCIDDQGTYLPIRKQYLESHGYEVITATSGAEGLGLLSKQHVDGVVLDYRMPGMDGGQVAYEIRRTYPKVRIVLLSGFPHDIPDQVRSLVDAVVVKGEYPSALQDSLRTVLGEDVLGRRKTTEIKSSVETVKKYVERVRRETASQKEYLDKVRERHRRA